MFSEYHDLPSWFVVISQNEGAVLVSNHQFFNSFCYIVTLIWLMFQCFDSMWDNSTGIWNLWEAFEGRNERPAAETPIQTTSKKAWYSEHDQNKTAVGTGDGEVEYKIQPWLFLWIWAWFWIRWGWTISVPTRIWNINLTKRIFQRTKMARKTNIFSQ